VVATKGEQQCHEVSKRQLSRSLGSSARLRLGWLKGRRCPEVFRKLGVTEQTYYRWKREYGGLRTDQAKRLKELEKENSQLKRLLADAELDKAILREVAEGRPWAA
jgi:transposase